MSSLDLTMRRARLSREAYRLNTYLKKLTKRMTSDEDFIEWICKKTGFYIYTVVNGTSIRKFPRVIELDYNILMKAVNEINKNTPNYKIIIMCDCVGVEIINGSDIYYFYNKYEYDEMLTLKLALLYIMENEK